MITNANWKASSCVLASVETSSLHQETIRALKQVNTAFTYAAYPIVEATGGLLSSRLATSEDAG